MSSPCIRCSQSGRPCIKSENYKNCSECSKVGRRCAFDKSPSPQDWQRLWREQEKLESAEASVESEVSHLLSEMSRLSAKRQRLLKQKKFLKDRAGKFLQSDVESLEELEKLEEEEQRQKDALIQEQQQTEAFLTTLNGSSSNNLPLNWTDLLDNLDSGGEIPSTSSPRSQDVS